MSLPPTKLHLEVSDRLTLRQAHDLVTRVEADILREARRSAHPLRLQFGRDLVNAPSFSMCVTIHSEPELEM